MRTRNQSRRPQQSNGEEEAKKSLGNADEVDDSCQETLSNISKDAVGRLLKRVKSRSRSLKKADDAYLGLHDSSSTLESESDKKNEQCSQKTVRKEDQNFSGDVIKNISSDFVTRNDLDESEWEEGSIPILDAKNSSQEPTINGVTVELDVSLDPVKRKPIRRATAEDKEVAELMHKVNLLCLLGRGRAFDNACNDPLIQASLLSLLPAHLLKIAEVPKLTAKVLTPLVTWFHKKFHVRGPVDTKKTPFSALVSALEAHEGTAEEVAALSVALFRALNLATRFVAVLDVISLKPDIDKPESSSQGTGKAGSGIFNSSTLMVAGSGHTSVSPSETAASDEKDGDCRTSVPCESKIKAGKLLKDNSEYKDLPVVHKLKGGVSDLSSSEPQDCGSDACFVKKSDRPKRKGDLEFEMQLEMALSATTIKHSEGNMNSNLVDVDNSPSRLSPALKKLKVVRAEESPVSAHEISTAIGSRKVGAPLYWAEVYCNGENLTGKWVHIDVVNAIIDGEQKVEAATAACKKSLRYVVSFAGLGAKDVTRRYCMKWHKIASQRINSMWWDAVLAPLKELESQATGGIVHLEQDVSSINRVEALPVADNQIQVYPPDSIHITGKANDEVCNNSTVKKELEPLSNPLAATRSTLEDIELDTRALTEPLPTNQQAYRNHQLYAIERWLNKYQILYPKGPVLGVCSGHPVYPRTCVQTLHTKERWLREGCQVKADELPSKILKRSLKHCKVQTGDDDECVEGDQVALYGKWQTEPLCLPHAVDGIVPKNERGQVDVWSEKCLPPGTVHLRLPRMALVARRLEIDFAPAMVGFEFRNGRSVPVFEGIVVCSEFKNAILEAYEEEEERRDAEERKRNEAQALSRWYQLLSSIVTRQRLKNCYGDGASLQTSTGIQKPDAACCAGAGGNQDGRKSPKRHQENLPDNKLQQYLPTEDHEHVFLLDDESFDGESSTRTKRCRCGFSIQFEEL